MNDVAIVWTLRNVSETPLWLFDVDAPYVILEEEGPRVTIASAWYPQPKGLDVYVVEQPPVQLVAPGDSLERTARLSLPLTSHTPYDRRGDIREVTSVELAIAVGYVPARRNIEMRSAYFRGGWRESIDVPYVDQRVVFSTPLPIALPLKIVAPAVSPFRRTTEPSPIEFTLRT